MQNARRRADSSALAIVNAISQVAQHHYPDFISRTAGRFQPGCGGSHLSRSAKFPPPRLQRCFRAVTHRAPESRLLSYIESLLTSNETTKRSNFCLGTALKKRYEDLFTRFIDEDTASLVETLPAWHGECSPTWLTTAAIFG